MSGNRNEKFMRIALKLAEKGITSPNPYVGAVIVKDGRVMGKGYHKRAGMDHAEVAAIKSLKNASDAKGAEMFVGLEPCNHYGRTPPCTKAIMEAGIGKVVFAMKDPNPEVKGGGEEELRKHGIAVESGVLEPEAQRINEIFVKYAKTRMPFVALKAAMSMDGKIATRNGDSKWITGEKARKYAHLLRSKYDSILVGINTVLKDDPQLTSRIRGGRNPLRVVLDDTLRIPNNAKVLADKNALVATSGKCDPARKMELEASGVRVLVCGKETVDLGALLAELGRMGITSVLVEGGSEVQGSFVDAKLVDKFLLFYAPIIIGGRGARPAIGGTGAETVSGAPKLAISSSRKIGHDIFVEAYPEQQ